MNHKAKLQAATKAYELDADGNLWTKPRGSRPIIQAAVLVVVNGLAYKLDTEALKSHLAPKPARKAKKTGGDSE